MTLHRLAVWGTVGGALAGAGYAAGDLVGAIVGAVVSAVLAWLTERATAPRQAPPAPSKPEPRRTYPYRAESTPRPGTRIGKVGRRAMAWARRKGKGVP